MVRETKLAFPKVLLIIIACSPVAGLGSNVECNKSKPSEVVSMQDAELPMIYRFLLLNDLDFDQIDRAHEELPCRSIELERESCYGPCPSYAVTLRADGTATYRGTAFVQKEGRYQGEVSIFALARLCYLAERIGVDRMSRRYTAHSTDTRTTILRIQRADGLLEIVDHGSVGPIELWGFFMTIDAVADRIEWVATE